MSIFSGKFGKPVIVADAHIPANIYLFKVNNKNTRKRCEICAYLTMKTPEPRQ